MRFFLAMFTSSFRNFSYCSLMYFSMGSQLEEGGRKHSEELSVPGLAKKV